jgi:hypothetical protein
MARAREASVLPVFAFGLVAVMNLVVIAIDYSVITKSKASIRHSLDSAALAALKKAVDKIEAGQEDKVDVGQLTTYAQRLIDANLAALNLSVDGVTVSFDYTDTIASLDIDYQYTTNLVFGSVPWTIRDRVSTEASVKDNGAYMDIQLLLDYSASMSTGATKKDQVELIKINNCAFACHQANIDKAHNAGIELRQDKLLKALNVLLETAERGIEEKDLEESSAQFTLRRFNTSMRMEHSATTDLDELRSAISRLPKAPSGSTDISRAISDTASGLPKSGKGTAEDDRRLFVFMITDGIVNRGSRKFKAGSGRGTLEPQDCKAVKDKGGIMAVVYTQYENYADSYLEAKGKDHRRNHFNHHVRYPWENVEEQLEMCASPGFFFNANNPQEMNDAMEKFFIEAVKTTKSGGLRLTT